MNKTVVAKADIREGLRRWELWLTFAWEDTRVRYRRTVLGPLWLTLGMAITVVGIGSLWSILWGLKAEVFFPYLASGLVTWQFIAGALTEGSTTFAAQASIIRSVPCPLTAHPMHLSTKLVIVFLHNLVVFVGVAIFFNVHINWWTLAFLPGLVLLLLNSIWIAFLFGMVGARYRDVPPMIGAILPLLFFVTPIMWLPEMLGEKRQFLVELNPLTHFLSIVRDPLLGRAPDVTSYEVVVAITLLGYACAWLAFRRYRSRIAFWV